jgi:cytoskeleton protein RodZ
MSKQAELIPTPAQDILRHERRQKGVTLERAARECRIAPAVLEAIESGETQHIPLVYLKGHIRNYARYLGLDPQDFEETLRDVEGADPAVRPVFDVRTRQGGAEKWIKVSSYLAASFVIAALAWQFSHQAVRLTQGPAELSSNEPGPAEVADTPQASQGHMTASIAPVEALGRRDNTASQHAAEDAWAALAQPPLAAGQHELSLETSADTWVEIYGADGRQLEMDLVRAGNSRSYRDAGPFRVMIGRASAVVVHLDGEVVDIESHAEGDVAKLVLAEAAPPVGAEADTTEPR